MPKHRESHNKPKSRLFSESGAAKIVLLAATFLLSASATVFMFMVMMKIDAEVASRRAAARQEGAAVNKNETAMYEEDNKPIPETNYSEMTIDVVREDPPAQQTSTQTPPRTSTSSRPVYTPTRPFSPQSLENTPQTSPRSSAGTPFMIDNASPNISYYALTFDGGSYAGTADEIFDTLASRGVKSTIFVTGGFIRRFPNVIIRAASEGHEVGNHMQTHPRLTTYAENRAQATRPGVTHQFVINELESAAKTLADRTGLRFAPFWRAPYGEYNRQICEWALEAGYIHIGWRQGGSWGRNLDTNDWVPNEDTPGYKTPQEVYDKIVHIAAQPGGLNGGIILLHLGTERKLRSQQVHIILGKLIDTLRDMGYEPVTVSELLHRSGVDLNALALYSNTE